MNTDDLARINESYKMIADIPGKFEGAQAFLAEGFTFKETYYNPLHTHNTGDLVQELREALIKFTIEKIAENTNYTINTKEVTDYINGTLGRSGFDAVAIKDYVNKHYKAKEDELSLIEIKKGVNSLTPNFWKDYRHRTPELSDLVKKNTLTLRCWLNWSYHWDYHGTIEKSSDFLIYHPSYPTFSSYLQIVNYHKVIPHQLPVPDPHYSYPKLHQDIKNSHYTSKKAIATANHLSSITPT